MSQALVEGRRAPLVGAPGPVLRPGRRRTCLWALLALLLPTVGRPQEPAPVRNRAVIVGINDYTNEGLVDLHCAAGDAQALARVLTDPVHGTFAAADVALLTDASTRLDWRPSSDNILNRLQDTAQAAQPGETVLFYFAGHGVEGYLLGQGTDPKYPENTGVPLGRVMAILADSRASRYVVIYDCCRGGGSAQEPLPPELTDTQVNLLKAGGSRPRLVLAACSQGEISREDTTTIGGGVFSQFLIEGLQKAADANGDGWVAASEAFDYAHDRTVGWAESLDWVQTPWQESHLSEQPRLTRPNPAAVPPRSVGAFLRARQAFGRGDYQAALDLCTEAIVGRSRANEAYRLRAECRRKLGDLDGARDDYVQALQFAPRDALAHAGLRALAQQGGQLPQVVTAYDRVLASHRTDTMCLARRATYHLALQHYKAAISDASAVLAAEPGNLEARRVRARCYLAGGDYPRALADLEQVLAARPDAAAYAARARCRVETGDLAGAQDDARLATRLNPSDPGPYLVRARCARQQGLWTEARLDYSAALGLDNLLEEAHLGYAECCLQEKRYDHALEGYTAALRLGVKTAAVYTGLGECLTRGKQYEQARDYYRLALQQEPQAGAAHFGLAHCCYVQGQWAAAVQSYTAALACGVSAEQERLLVERGLCREQLGQAEEALADYALALKAAPGYVRAHTCAAALHKQAGRLVEAAAALGRALALTPRDHSLHLEHAACLKSLGRWEEAIAAYGAAIALDKQYNLAYIDLAACYEARQQWQEAADNYRTGIALGWRKAEVCAARARCLRALGQLEAAVEAYNLAHEVAPQEPAYLVSRAGCYRELPTPDHSRALQDCQAALAIAPGYAPAHLERARCYVQMRQPQKALIDFADALKYGAAEAEVRRERAACYLQLDQPQAALEDCQAVVAAAQPTPATLACRAECYFRLEQYEAAAADCRAVLQVQAGNTAIRLRLAQSKAALQLYPEALADCDRLLVDDEGNRTVRLLRARCHLARGSYALCRADCELVLAGDGGNLEARRCRAEAAFLAGDYPAALTDYSELLKPFRGEAGLWQRRGACLLQTGDHRRALADYDQSLRLKATAEGHYGRAKALLLGGRTQEARTAAQQSRDLGQQDDPLGVFAALAL